MTRAARLLMAACVAWIGLCLAGHCAAGDAVPDKRAAVDYLHDVKPLLSKHCYACHGALKQKAGLRLDTAALLRKGGDGGPAIAEGKSDESLITDAITGREGWQMPPEGEGSRLSAHEIATVRAWIDQGASAPAEERPQKDPRKHWAFRSPARPPVPRVSATRAAWVRNPIDAFLAEKHEQKRLIPSPSAPPHELIRRVYLDLIGLVPTPEEVRAFAADPSDRAYEEMVDRLLASPQYGERWGRHWMDVWRYSDWDGFGNEIRESQPHIWRWRDWIVESLNADQGYDQMIVQMLAADEAAPENPGALRATGFLVRNWFKFNRNVWLDSTVEHTAKAFLGLTINCARCHDHKYDPIAQTEYYRFRAFFEPHATRIDRLPGHADTQKDGLVRVFDSEVDAKTVLFTRGDEKRPVQDQPLTAGVPRALEREAKLGAIAPVVLAPTVYYPALNGFFQDEALARAKADLEARKSELSRAETSLSAAKNPADLNKARGAAELARKSCAAAGANLVSLEARSEADRARFAQPTRADAPALARAAAKVERLAELHRAEEALLRAELALAEVEQVNAAPNKPANDKTRKAAAKARTKRDQARIDLKSRRQKLEQEPTSYSPLGPIYPTASTGRRLALARWIADRRNPLTARVAINHIWMRHFGAPLVPTEFDFGNNGKAPTHPALLDWLAVELIDSGWRMKNIHRLIVTSSAYRMRSSSRGPDDPNLAIDPRNQDYWRMNPRRMEAEAVRDNLLRVAGNLDLTVGGPDLDPETGLTSSRRSLYFRHAKEKRVTFLRVFDSSNVQSCYRRAESIVPQQALALANSPLSFSQARRLAASLSRPGGQASPRVDDPAFVSKAFDQVLGRGPTPEEQFECVHYLAVQTERLADRSKLTPFPAGASPSVPPATDPAQRARESLVHVLLNHNDFVTIR
jgi:mono/diheme cytochrome c family protein